MNSIDYFDRGWSLNPSAPCLVDAQSGQVFTYDQVRHRTLRIAQALRRDGFGEQHKGAVLSYNDANAYATVLGLMRRGLAWIPINPRNSHGEVAQILKSMDCDILFFQSDFEPAVSLIRQECTAIRQFVCIDADASGIPSIEDWLGDAVAEELELVHDGERLFAIQPTGGTTGFPKGVMIPNRALETIVAAMLSMAPSDTVPVFLAAAPLTHAAGMVFQYLMAQGGSAVIFAKIDREALLDAIPAHRITHVFLPPTVIYELLPLAQARPRDFRSLLYFFYGAGPMAPERLAQAIDVFGPVMAQVYGQTEVGFPVTYLSPREHVVDGRPAALERLSSCGRVTPFWQAAIMGESGKLLGVGEVGEIVVRGQGLMLGYYKDPESTAESSRDGWHHTGDIGYRDPAGYYYIVDRAKDMIISGGFNVYSAEVEKVLMNHPAVRECAVIGVPDAKWGEAVKAIAVLHEGQSIDAQALIAHCRKELGGVKTPKSVDFVEALPRSPLGKVLKRDLRERYWSSQRRMVS